MKAIGIVGRPRKKGNVDTLVQTVLDGAKEAGYQITKYNLNEMKYSGCQACGYCKSHDHCQLDDDVSMLLEEIAEADHRAIQAYGGQNVFIIDAGFKVFSVLVELMKDLADPAFSAGPLERTGLYDQGSCLSSCSANFLLRLI